MVCLTKGRQTVLERETDNPVGNAGVTVQRQRAQAVNKHAFSLLTQSTDELQFSATTLLKSRNVKYRA